jgi:hypothetical protein
MTAPLNDGRHRDHKRHYKPPPELPRELYDPTRACVDEPRELFFRSRVEDARRICAGCPVRIREACAEHAIVHSEEGVWGGLTDEERVQERKRRRDTGALYGATKVCTTCGERKTTDQFNRKLDNRDQLRNTCRTCQKENYIRWYTEKNRTAVQ